MAFFRVSNGGTDDGYDEIALHWGFGQSYASFITDSSGPRVMQGSSSVYNGEHIKHYHIANGMPQFYAVTDGYFRLNGVTSFYNAGDVIYAGNNYLVTVWVAYYLKDN